MINAFVILIIAKRRFIDEVPSKLKEAVILELGARGYNENGDVIEVN